MKNRLLLLIVTISMLSGCADIKRAFGLADSGDQDGTFIPILAGFATIVMNAHNRPKYAVGGTVSGLLGSNLVIQNNDGDNFDIVADGDFTFPIKITDGTSYSVTVLSHPGGPTQDCLVFNGTGTIASGAVSDVSIVCQDPVAPLYVNNGANWNDYVANNGVDVFSADDTACDAALDGPGPDACLHGGAMRIFSVPGRSNCVGLSAEDSEQAFEWSCDDSTNPVRMISTGLRDSGFLSDLLDFNTPAWKNISVTVRDGGAFLCQTAARPWANNQVLTANTGGTLNSAGTVYTVSANPAATITLAAHKIALVIEPGVTLTGDPAISSESVIAANSMNFLWVEGAVDASADFYGLNLNSITFSKLRNIIIDNSSSRGLMLSNSIKNWVSSVQIRNALNHGIVLDNSAYNVLTDISAEYNGQTGIMVYLDSNNNTLLRLTIIGNQGAGMQLSDSGTEKNTVEQVVALNNNIGVGLYNGAQNNVLQHILASNHIWYGVFVSDANNNSLIDISTTNNYSYGIYLSGAQGNFLSNIHAANNGGNGIGTYMANNNSLNNLALTNNSDGLLLADSNNNIVHNISSANNDIYGIELILNSSGNTFSGTFQVGNNGGDCYVDAESTNGALSDDDNAPGGVDLDHEGFCIPVAPSDFGSALSGVTHASAFRGKVEINDPANFSDIDGTAGFPIDQSSFDWIVFENNYRAWGIDGGAFPSFDQRGRFGCSNNVAESDEMACTGGGGVWNGNGRIWDWTPANSDSIIRGALSQAADGNLASTLAHIWYVDTDPVMAGNQPPTSQTDCDIHQPGSVFVNFHCENAYLRNAVDLIGYAGGNNNGLCESGETCLFTPNIHAYQGHGNLIPAGNPTNGDTIADVILLKHQVNGR